MANTYKEFDSGLKLLSVHLHRNTQLKTRTRKLNKEGRNTHLTIMYIQAGVYTDIKSVSLNCKINTNSAKECILIGYCNRLLYLHDVGVYSICMYFMQRAGFIFDNEDYKH